LEENRIDYSGAVALAEALKLNTSLTNIDFSSNLFTEEGTLTLKESARRNPRLTYKV